MQSVIPPVDDSPLALATRRVQPEAPFTVADESRDSLVYVAGGSGSLSLDGAAFDLEPDAAALVLAGEQATFSAASILDLVHVTIGAVADLHAALGPRETVVRVDRHRTEHAFGTRAFQVLFGPHNGSIRATVFAGFIPPGRSPWHYHLYDEIVWIPQGPGRLHRPDSEAPEPLSAGAAFRLRPRHVHIVENATTDDEMTVIGFFTPAGTPSAAYLADIADAGRVTEAIS